MGITYGDHLIDSGYHDITPEQEREIESRQICVQRGIDPDELCADGGVTAWMIVAQEPQRMSKPVLTLEAGTPEFDAMVAADPLLSLAASIICGAACGMYSACNSREAAVALRDAGLLTRPDMLEAAQRAIEALQAEADQLRRENAALSKAEVHP